MSLNAASWVESAFNRLLSHDLAHREALSKYKDKILVVDFINTRAIYAITITDYGISLATEPPSSVDVTIRATPLALINYLGALKRSEPLVSGAMEITGDIALAQGILSIIRELNIDWEEYLSYWTGDILAHKAGKLVGNTLGALQYAHKSLRNDVSEYLQYESSLLISGSEMQDFNSSVDDLRDDTERLKARVNRIQKTTEGQD